MGVGVRVRARVRESVVPADEPALRVECLSARTGDAHTHAHGEAHLERYAGRQVGMQVVRWVGG